MKKKKKNHIAKRMASTILALTMAAELTPGLSLIANAEVDEKMVTTLANIYDGDEARAREELEAMYQAGIIDENGNMVTLDIKENEVPVTLDELVSKITNNEEVGDITVNNHSVTTQQILKISEFDNILKIVKMMGEDVEITDEHVENLESLIQGIGDGSIDIDKAIESGELSLDSYKTNIDNGSDEVIEENAEEIVEEAINTEETTVLSGKTPAMAGDTVNADAKGNYTAPLIKDSTYNKNYTFTLADPQNKTVFTDSKYQGIISDGVITFSCAATDAKGNAVAAGKNGEFLAAFGGKVTVTATLNKAQSVPVSFDWSAAGAAISEKQSGSVSWNAGETGAKTFEVTVTKPEGELWRYGSRAFVISATNVKGALANNNMTTWNQTVKVSANDGAISNTYTWIAGDTYAGNTFTSYVADNGYGNCNCFKRSINCLGDAVRVTVSYKTSVINSGKNTFHTDHLDVKSNNENYAPHSIKGAPRLFGDLDGGGDKSASGTKGVTPGTNYLYLSFGNTDNIRTTLNSVKLEHRTPQKTTRIESVSVPEGTYYSGQVVPVTIKLSQYASLRSTNTLTVNGVDCPLLDASSTESNKFTFGYTVKDSDSGSINVTGLKGTVYNAGNVEMTVDGSFPTSSFDSNHGSVKIVSAAKQASLDMANIKYGISDDEPGEQILTVLIPFKSGASTTWIASEEEECKTNGKSIKMPVPAMPNATADNYLRGAYASFDNGKTRYPVYVINNGGNETAALAIRFAPDLNATPNLRLDNLNLFMDTTVGISDATKYLDTWANAKKDSKGFAYFDGTGKDNAPICVGQTYSYYVKGGIMFDQTAYTSRGTADYASKTKDGWLNLDDKNHILLQDASKPANQYDVEIVGNDDFYKGCVNGLRAEDTSDITLSWQVSGRKNFTFTDPKYFSWECSNPNVASITTDENGVGHIEITGNPGTAEFTLHIGNGSESKKYDIKTPKMTVLEGKTPFLNISKYSQFRQTLTDTGVDIAFASNVTVRNDQAGHDTTTYTAKLYKAKESGDSFVKDGDVLWTADFNSTVEELATHITVPGEQLDKPGTYYVEITTKFFGGKVKDVETLAQDLSANAFINVKQAPAKITLDQLDSYYVTAGNIPTISYTVTPDTAEVEYTIQKTGENVSNRMTASNGTIPFSASKPVSLKEAYTITVYARNNEEEDWSIDSMLLTVYNPDILHQIVTDVTAGEVGGTTNGTGDHADGTTIHMDNHEKIKDYGVNGSNYQLTYEDLTEFLTDMSLQKIVSVNYGETVYGALSDKMQWESSDSEKISVDYKQGGFYSDIRNYNYTSYTPTTDLLIVGKDDVSGENKVTIKATHANTGISTSFDVTASTLKDQLYVFQFNPPIKTDVTYTNGKGVKRTIQSDDKGELAVYEPDGITGSVMTMAKKDNKTYVGTLFQSDLQTGERDIASLQLYPCNNLRLREISNAVLTFQKPDGKPYSGRVTIRGGVYKNGKYCPDAKLRLSSNGEEFNGRKDITANVNNGRLEIHLDPTQFKIDPNNNSEEFGGAQPGDNLTYVFEYRFANSYQPGYVTLTASTDLEGESSPSDSVVFMRNLRGSVNQPQIINQKIREYFDGNAMADTSNVIDFADNIGVSTRYNKVDLITDAMLVNENRNIVADEKGYSSFSSNSITKLELCTQNDSKLTGQVENKQTTADQIIELSNIESSQLFVFPFSSMPITRNLYTITDENLTADGITDEGTDPHPTSPVKARFVRNNVKVKNETLPFGVSNLSHQRDLTEDDGGAKEIAEEVGDEIEKSFDIGSVFKQIDGGDMLRKGFVFLSKMQVENGEYAPHLIILPTQDPGAFRIIAFVGYDKRERDDGDEEEEDSPISLEYDPNEIADNVEDFQKTIKEFSESDKKEKKKKKKPAKKKGKEKDKESDGDDDDDDDDDKPYEFNFYGTIILEAKLNDLGNKWDINFNGGNVGASVEVKFEWSQTFMCGAPIHVSFEAKATADLEIAFANKGDTVATLVDAAIGGSLEAFAGLGFDLSIVSFKLGIFGEIGATNNFLYLSTVDKKKHKANNYVGNSLNISGEISLKMEAKLLIITYEKTFCSFPFKLVDKQWGDYKKIKEMWEEDGYADLLGFTSSGKSYNMHLMPNGMAMVAIDNGNRIENRDNLDRAARESYMSGGKTPMLASDGGMAELQSNAYPYSNPVLTDDGSIMLYISDNDNADKIENVVCYAVKNGNGYTDMGRVDTSEDNILADTDVVASGTGDNAFAAWVKQMDSPEKEMNDTVTYDDLGMMINATEIYGSSYSNGKWKTERLTDNTVGDMSPTIASSENKAIVAWRSLCATEMPEENSDQDFTAMFNAENNINYRIFDGKEWKEAQIAYNGTAGTVNAIDSAMLPDGTSILVYTVRTGEETTSTETFYTIIDNNGDIVTTGRLTNDDYTDNNAQVVAVGDRFVVGWYSEHASNESEDSEAPVVSHDIGLARINANGSVDANFPESIGGDADSTISTDFRFSAPVNNDDINKLSIIWSQPKESSAAEDSGKYQLNAIRFYEDNGNIGVTSQATISETTKNYKIDKFDSYTDQNGEIKAVLIGSDYNSIDGIGVFDTIDLNDLPIQAVNDSGDVSDYLSILEQNPISSIRLASGSLPKVAFEASADTDLYSLMPESTLPVQFTVKNTGTSMINTINAVVGGQNKQFTNLNLLPNETTVITFGYMVPTNVSDISYTLTADGSAVADGTLMLNCPDVGIGNMQVTRSSDKTRDVQVNIGNASDIPLVGSNKTVKLAFFKDSTHQEQLGNTITIDPTSYQLIDNDIYTYTQTFNVSDLIGNAEEIPENGVRIYAETWVDDTDELYTNNNSSSVTLNGLLSKYGSQLTMDAALVGNEDEGYNVEADIRNNSLQKADAGDLVADILDKRQRVLASVPVTNGNLILEGEQIKNYSVKVPELKSEPMSVSLRSSQKSVFLDAKTCGGTVDAATITLTADNKPAGILPEATRNGYKFTGWFTKPNGGDQITNETVLSGGNTIYAQFDYIKQDQTFTISMEDYEYDQTAHTPKITGKVSGDVTTTYYNTDTGEKLAEAPSEPGHYRVEVYAEGDFYYNEAKLTKEYRITSPDKFRISVKNGTFKDGSTLSYFEKNTIVAATADAAEEGYKFGYWKKNGVTISYNPTYTFYASADEIELEAVYIEDTDDVERYGNAKIESVTPDKENGKLRFVSILNVPEDCKILKAGIVATSDAEKGKNLTAENADYVRSDATDKHNYRYTWTKTSVTADQTWYVKGYLVYEDAKGEQKTVYSDLTKSTLEGSETIIEDKIVGTAVMESVTPLPDEQKLRFAAMLNVPADCTINKAGIVATSDAEKGKNLTAENADYVRADATTKHGYRYTWTKTKVTADQTWYVRPYLVYTNANGKEFTVYGDLSTGKIN